jgi:hypothetical protein
MLMKKASVLLLLIILSACTSPGMNLEEKASALKGAFEISEECPKLCWLGINPGLTTTTDAIVLLQASPQIDQLGLQVSVLDIQADWFPNEDTVIPIHVYLDTDYDSGIVNSISFSNLPQFSVGDLVTLLGKPNAITIELEQMPDSLFLPYTLYYSSSTTMIYVIAGSESGPSEDDFVGILSLNLEFDSRTLPESRINDYEKSQPWLGYRNLEKYLHQE